MTLDRLLELRGWLTVDEAARQLSKTLDGKVSKGDVLQLALDGQLKLSVNLPAGTGAMRFEEGSERPTVRQQIEGLWELPMTGAGRRQVEAECSRGPWLAAVSEERWSGVTVEWDGVRCQLLAQPGAKGVPPRSESDLPFVVRTAVLAECVAQMPQPSPKAPAQPVEKKLGERERTTLLTIIAAVAKEAKIDISKPTKAGETISTLIAAMGYSVAPNTVARHLRILRDKTPRQD